MWDTWCCKRHEAALSMSSPNQNVQDDCGDCQCNRDQCKYACSASCRAALMVHRTGAHRPSNREPPLSTRRLPTPPLATRIAVTDASQIAMTPDTTLISRLAIPRLSLQRAAVCQHGDILRLDIRRRRAGRGEYVIVGHIPHGSVLIGKGGSFQSHLIMVAGRRPADS